MSLPESWKIQSLQDVCRETISYGIVQCGPHIRDGIPYIRVSDMDQRELDIEGMLRTSPGIASRFFRSTVEAGDLVYALRGKLGEVRKVPPEVAGANLTQGTARIAPRSEISSDYLMWAMRGPDAIRQAGYQAKGSTFVEITLENLRNIQIAVPAPPEQRAIATALSDVDALIAGLEKLTTKKRELKQAAMQQLLTGQTRLPGFSGKWDKTVFSEILRHHSGNSSLIKGKQFDRPMPNLFPGFSASGQDVWCSAYELEGDAIVVSAVGSRCGKAFHATGRWCAIANTHVVWPDERKIDRRFLSFFVNDEDFWLKSGSGQPFVLFKQTFSREVRLPPIVEQIQIADAISDLEAELETLKNRLSKTREIKQGMMQELLTGRTRLV